MSRPSPNSGSRFSPLDRNADIDFTSDQAFYKSGFEEFEADGQKSGDSLPIWSTLLQALLVLVYTVYACLPASFSTRLGWFHLLSSKVLVHSVLYAVVSTITLCIFYRHRRSRRRGFLKFYRSISRLRRTPYLSLSVGNALVLPLWSLSNAGGGDGGHAAMLLSLVSIFECLVVVPSCLVYVHRVRDYNSSTPVPDYQQMLNAGREKEEGREDPLVVMRYQADMIKFLEVKVTDLKTQLLSVVNDQSKRASTHQRSAVDEDMLQLVHERDELRNQLEKQAEAVRSRSGTVGGVDPSHLKEKIRLQQTIKELRCQLKRAGMELEVERDAHQAAQSFLEQYQRDGNTSSSALDD